MRVGLTPSFAPPGSCDGGLFILRTAPKMIFHRFHSEKADVAEQAGLIWSKERIFMGGRTILDPIVGSGKFAKRETS